MYDTYTIIDLEEKKGMLFVEIVGNDFGTFSCSKRRLAFRNEYTHSVEFGDLVKFFGDEAVIVCLSGVELRLPIVSSGEWIYHT